MNIDESKVPTAAKGSIEAGYGPKHRGDSLAAADLGVTLSPEQDEICPPVILGQGEYITDAAGKPIDRLPQGEPFRKHYKEMSIQEQGCFRQGMIYASMTALKQKAYTAHTAIISEVHTLRGEA